MVQTAEERASLRVLAILAEHGAIRGQEKSSALAIAIVAGIIPGADWAQIERLSSGDYILCDGYCGEDR